MAERVPRTRSQSYISATDIAAMREAVSGLDEAITAAHTALEAHMAEVRSYGRCRHTHTHVHTCDGPARQPLRLPRRTLLCVSEHTLPIPGDALLI